MEKVHSSQVEITDFLLRCIVTTLLRTRAHYATWAERRSVLRPALTAYSMPSRYSSDQLLVSDVFTTCWWILRSYSATQLSEKAFPSCLPLWSCTQQLLKLSRRRTHTARRIKKPNNRSEDVLLWGYGFLDDPTSYILHPLWTNGQVPPGYDECFSISPMLSYRVGLMQCRTKKLLRLILPDQTRTKTNIRPLMLH